MRAIYIRTETDYLYCRVIGSGEPLLLLHGNGEDHKIFEHQLAFFSNYFQVIALDTRGHGRSDHGKETLTFQKIAQDILTVLDYLELNKVHVMGFSDGGNCALYLASHFPEKVDKMVIIGANYEADGMNQKSVMEIKLSLFQLNLLSKLHPKFRKRKEVIDLMWHQLDLKASDLISINAPVLVVAGEKDVIKETQTRKMHTLIPHSDLVIIPRAGHFLMVEEHEAFNLVALEFLNGKKIQKENYR